MDLKDTLQIAGRSLYGHRLRSTLTVVGIVIGIGAVVAFASFGFSVQGNVLDEFEETSANEIVVAEQPDFDFDSPGSPPDLDDFGSGPIFTETDATELEGIEGVTDVVRQGSVAGGISAYNDSNLSLDPTITAISSNQFADDDFISGEAYEDDGNGIVITESTRESLQQNVPEENISVGGTITVDPTAEDEQTLLLVGIIEETDTTLLPDFGDGYYISTSNDLYGGSLGTDGPIDEPAYEQLTVTAPPDNVREVQDNVEAYIFDDSDAATQSDNISVTSSLDIIEGVESVLTDVTQFVIGIGILALIVGAFGIANIMLVSVTERTKEIGIMKAIGARNRDIMGLFLSESIMLGVLGALVGIPIGLGTGYIASSYADVGFVIPFDWIAIAVGMGIATGIIAGLYPAWRATRVDPIEALRYE